MKGLNLKAFGGINTIQKLFLPALNLQGIKLPFVDWENEELPMSEKLNPYFMEYKEFFVSQVTNTEQLVQILNKKLRSLEVKHEAQYRLIIEPARKSEDIKFALAQVKNGKHEIIKNATLTKQIRLCAQKGHQAESLSHFFDLMMDELLGEYNNVLPTKPAELESPKTEATNDD